MGLGDELRKVIRMVLKVPVKVGEVSATSASCRAGKAMGALDASCSRPRGNQSVIRLARSMRGCDPVCAVDVEKTGIASAGPVMWTRSRTWTRD